MALNDALLPEFDAERAHPWTPNKGRRLLFTLPKAAHLRTFEFSRGVNHRAQGVQALNA